MMATFFDRLQDAVITTKLDLKGDIVMTTISKRIAVVVMTEILNTYRLGKILITTILNRLRAPDRLVDGMTTAVPKKTSPAPVVYSILYVVIMIFPSLNVFNISLAVVVMTTILTTWEKESEEMRSSYLVIKE